MDQRRTLLTLTTLFKSLLRLICKQAKRPLHLLLTVIFRLIGVHSSTTQGRRTAGDDDSKDPQPKSIDSAQEQGEKPFNDLSADSCGGNGVENNISRFCEENDRVFVSCPSYDPLPGPYTLSAADDALEGYSHDHPTSIADSSFPRPRGQNEAEDSGQHSRVLSIQSLGGHVRRTSESSTGTLIEAHPLHDLQIFGEVEDPAKETVNTSHIEVTVGGEGDDDDDEANVVIELGDPQDRLCAEPVGTEEEISPHIYPIMPKDVPRYTRGRMLEEVIPRYVVQPRQIEFIDGILPLGWEKIISPEGLPYFWHSEDRILTDNWLPDANVASHLLKFVEDIKDFLRKENLQQTNEVHLVLDVVRQLHSEYPDDPVKETWWCGYYYVNHTERSIFWQESFDISEYLDEVKGDLAHSHVKLYLETQYWQHWALYPDVCPVSHELLRRYEDTVRDAQADVLTSNVATMNLSFEELDHMMAIMQQAKDAIIQDKKSAHDFWTPSMSTWFIGRFMQMMTKSHFVNFYGQKCCRLDTRTSIHGHTPGHKLKDFSLMFRILSPLLFCAPDVHLVTMNELWVDQLTLDKPWKRLFDRLYDDWKAQLVYASLLLTSNIAFLAVPTVTNQDAITHGTSVQVPSYVSSICSAASLLLGLLLSRQHQNRGTSALDIHEWLMKRRHPTRGLEPLAVMFSLPFALLMWGMVTFLIGFTIFCFKKTTIGARVSAGFFWLAATALVIWYIWMSWDTTTDRWSSTLDHIISPGSFWDKHILTPIKSRSSRGSTRSERTRWKKMKKLLKRRKNAQPSISTTNGTQTINDPIENV